MNATDWQPIGDSVLIQRLEPIEQARDSSIVITDMATADAKMLIRKGRVLATGPGKWVDGYWRKIRRNGLEYANPMVEPGNLGLLEWDEWVWEYGYWEQCDVQPGDIVLFNARWNDFGSSDHKRALPVGFDPTIHLVQEADIAGKLHE